MKNQSHFTLLDMKRLLLLVLVFIGHISCISSNENPEEVVLSTSLSTVIFGNDGGEETIVISGVKEWNYISNVNWLSINQDDNKMQIQATSNLLPQERSASILIVSKSGGNRKIEIKQAGAVGRISFGDEVISFPAGGESRILSVLTNMKDWTLGAISEDVQIWLKINSIPSAKVIVLEVAPNPTYDERHVDIVVTADNGEKALLSISQMGKAKYILPYFSTQGKYKKTDMFEFEMKRGSTLIGHQDPSYDRYEKKFITGVSQWSTASDFMPMIIYTHELGEPNYSKAQTLLEDTGEVRKPHVEAYMSMLQENGFELKEEESGDAKKVFMKNDGTMSAMMIIQAGGAIIQFETIYVQSQAYPTFDTIPQGPEGFMTFLNNPKYKVQDIIDFETALGSEAFATVKDKKDDSLTALLGFTVKQPLNKHQEAFRTYNFYTKEHKQVSGLLQSSAQQTLYFSETTLGLFTVGRRKILTREFLSLAKSAGYTLLGQGRSGDFYFSKYEKPNWQSLMVVDYVQYSDLNDGLPMLEITHLDQYNTGDVNTTSVTDLMTQIKAAQSPQDLRRVAPIDFLPISTVKKWDNTPKQ